MFFSLTRQWKLPTYQEQGLSLPSPPQECGMLFSLPR